MDLELSREVWAGNRGLGAIKMEMIMEAPEPIIKITRERAKWSTQVTHHIVALEPRAV